MADCFMDLAQSSPGPKSGKNFRASILEDEEEKMTD